MKRQNRQDNKGERLKGKEIEKGKVYGVYIDSMLTKKVILSILLKLWVSTEAMYSAG